MSDFRFFTDLHLLGSHKPVDGGYECLGFGIIQPLNADPPTINEFSVSSIHIANGDVNPTAYAVCDGNRLMTHQN
jgi:hypothetical protein